MEEMEKEKEEEEEESSNGHLVRLGALQWETRDHVAGAAVGIWNPRCLDRLKQKIRSLSF